MSFGQCDASVPEKKYKLANLVCVDKCKSDQTSRLNKSDLCTFDSCPTVCSLRLLQIITMFIALVLF